ncbi:MAG: ATP-binding cassette domain-containing protein [Quadrisphaera sp.]
MIELRSLTKTYGEGQHATTVLDALDLTVSPGEITAVVGPSGAGKSTLAACTTLLERPTSGAVVVGGRDLTALSEKDLREARRGIGTVFQADGLLTRRTAAQNVELPLKHLGVVPAQRRARVAELLERVGLADKAHRYPHELSGGQRQRVGIARALALRPGVLLSDEATSGLDPQATASIVALLKELRDDLQLAVLFITHERDTVVAVADTVARLDHGRIVEHGALVDLLHTPASPLGRALLPRRAHAGSTAEDGATGAAAQRSVWVVSHAGNRVPRRLAGPRLPHAGHRPRAAGGVAEHRRRGGRGPRRRRGTGSSRRRRRRGRPHRPRAPRAARGVRRRRAARRRADPGGRGMSAVLLSPLLASPVLAATSTDLTWAEIPALVLPALGDTLVMVGVTMAVVVVLGVPWAWPWTPSALAASPHDPCCTGCSPRW